MKPILDACCGGKMFWFNKQNPNAIFCDIRRETHNLSNGQTLVVDPDIIADFRKMPFRDNQFKLVVFDPPHLKGCGFTGWQGKKYGSLDKNWPEYIKAGFDECMRVLDHHGTLIFKWNEQTIKVSDVLKVIGRDPLFGHRTLQHSKTIWMAFMKGTL
jgi:23S rRNA G2069 N7-methylase RlmK/C1962 C5-methylase RlmI